MMVRLHYSVDLTYHVLSPSADFVFTIEAARTPRQTVLTERLLVTPPLPLHSHVDAANHTRTLRLQAPTGPLRVRYNAVVDIDQQLTPPAQLAEVPIDRLPPGVLPYLYPSRYCESDRLHNFAVAQFGWLWQGCARVQAIRDWVAGHAKFKSNTSLGTTSACDTLISRQGVCRDFAHLMIALCRAVNIPARFTTGLDYGADPMLGPPDFHAYVEAFVGDRWVMFDPSGTAIPMGFVRIATGRDAADCAFATIFGSVQAQAPVVQIEAVPNRQGTLVVPVHRSEAISTDTAAT